MEELTWEVVSGKHLASSGKYSVATWEVWGLPYTSLGEQERAQGKAAGNFGCSIFGKMQPLPLTAVSTLVPVGHLFRAEVNHSCSGGTLEQRQCYREVLCSTESSGKRV